MRFFFIVCTRKSNGKKYYVNRKTESRPESVDFLFPIFSSTLIIHIVQSDRFLCIAHLVCGFQPSMLHFISNRFFICIVCLLATAFVANLRRSLRAIESLLRSIRHYRVHDTDDKRLFLKSLKKSILSWWCSKPGNYFLGTPIDAYPIFIQTKLTLLNVTGEFREIG